MVLKCFSFGKSAFKAVVKILLAFQSGLKNFIFLC